MWTRCRCPSAPSDGRSPPAGPRAYRTAAAVTVLALVAYTAAVGLALRPRDGHAGRLDVASAAAILLNVGVAALHIRLWRALPPPRGKAALEVFGASYDPWMGRGMLLLLALETRAFAHYAGGPPGCAQALAQGLGIALGGLTLFVVARADHRLLAAGFDGKSATPRLATDGPYRRCRHPRYAALLASRLALALLPGWALLVGRRIVIEERRLRARFGRAYLDYAAETPRLLPRLRGRREAARP